MKKDEPTRRAYISMNSKPVFVDSHRAEMMSHNIPEIGSTCPVYNNIDKCSCI